MLNNCFNMNSLLQYLVATKVSESSLATTPQEENWNVTSDSPQVLSYCERLSFFS